MIRAWLCTCAAMFACAASPSAQVVESGQRHRVEATAGALWIGGAGFGSEDANLRANGIPAAPFTLFKTDTKLGSAAGIDAGVGYWLTPSLAVEAGFVFGRPHLKTQITADVEGAPSLTAEERIDQYFIDGRVTWLLGGLRLTAHTVPFISGGIGYLRELHEGRTLVETGQVYHVGGGLRHWLRQRDAGWIRGAGLRVDARAYVLVNGVKTEGGPRTHGALSGSVFLTF